MSKTKCKGRNTLTNRLWLARKRRSLEQKQVAYLLNHPGIDQISRYEQGIRLPSLAIALKLEIIYGVPLRLLFKELFDSLEDEVWQRISLSTPLQRRFGNRTTNKAGRAEYCAYTELLMMPNASEADRSRVRRHVTELAKKLAYL
ncbi:MAG TPA: helix-turn-helix domain-containing protein [Pyrinomonadaceae bacterium]|jgi:transcriptional regulator with XRE-family HTH domain